MTEVSALIEERGAEMPGDGAGETIAKVQASRMATAAAVALRGVGRYAGHLAGEVGQPHVLRADQESEPGFPITPITAQHDELDEARRRHDPFRSTPDRIIKLAT